MKGHESGPIIRGKENTIQQIRGNTIEEFKLEGVFHVADTRGGGDYIHSGKGCYVGEFFNSLTDLKKYTYILNIVK